MALPEEPIPITATEFLGHFFDGIEGWMHVFAIDRTTGDRHVIWKPTSDPAALTQTAKRYVDTSCIWFGVAPRHAHLGGRRGDIEDCTGIPALWLDLDVQGPNHVAEDLPPTKEAALELLGDFPIPASILIDSGGGYQAYWLFHELLALAPARELLTRWGATWAENGRVRQWHVDNVFEAAHVMRLPATYNRKSQPPVAVEVVWAHWDQRYNPDDIDQWCIDPPDPIDTTTHRKVTYIGPERPGDAYNAVTDPGQILEAVGWELDHIDRGAGDRHYRAPHHSGERGMTGATVYADGHTTIWSETFARQHGMQVKRPYDPFGLYALIHHQGDWKAASDELAVKGYGTPNPSMAAWINSMPSDPTDQSDWAPIDLTEIARSIRSGGYKPIQPVVLAVEDSIPLFYPERVNSLFAESGGGKTWVALVAVAETVRGGRRVLFIDYEDTPAGTTERLVALGLTDDEIGLIDYMNPVTALALGIGEIAKTFPDVEHGLVVIDSTGESMASGGTDPNDDPKVATWFRLARLLARRPGHPAVLVLDHIPKDKDAPTSYAIGSQRKRAAITGASYRVDVLKEPARGHNGTLKLTVAKDRLGNRVRGTVAAIIDITSSQDTIEFRSHLSDAQIAEQKGEEFRPTIYMERISQWLEQNPPSSKNALCETTSKGGVGGKRQVLDIAIERLLVEGFIGVENGPRQSKVYRSVRPFRQISDSWPVDNPDLSTYVPPMDDLCTSIGRNDLWTGVPQPPTGGTPVHRSEGSADPTQPTTYEPVDNYDLFGDGDPQ